jgi:hypothetical protein
MRTIAFTSVLLLLLLAGCSALQTATPDQPLGGIDPNDVQAWINTAVAAGQTTTAVGTATGNPAVAGTGSLIAIIAGAVGATLIGRKAGGQYLKELRGK